MINITPTQLRKAADLQEKIQSLQEELGQLLGGPGGIAAEAPETPKKRKMSAAGRARIAAAARARWAKIKGKAPSAKPAPKKKLSAQGLANIRAGVRKRMMAQAKRIAPSATPAPKRKMSAAGRARLAALAKARWAKAKQEGKSRL